MKKIALIISILSCIFIISCKKTNSNKLSENNKLNHKYSNRKQINFTKKDLKISDATANLCNRREIIFKANSTEKSKIVHSIINSISSMKEKEECSENLAEEIHKNILNNKNNISIKDVSNSDIKADYNIFIIGSGVHSSIFSRNYKIKHPNAKILTIDSSKSISEHFNSTDYLINSPEGETNDSSTNILKNSPIILSDLGESTDKFYIAQKLWQVIVYNSFVSNTDILLDTKIDKIEYLSDKNLFKVLLNNNATFYSEKVIISNGLGTPKFENISSEELKNEQLKIAETCTNESCLPNIITFDDLIKINQIWKKNGKNVYNTLANPNNNLAVIGAGDAANVIVEFLYDQAPSLAYNNVNSSIKNNISKIYWFAQKHTTGVSFINDSNIKPRYKVFKKDFYIDLFNNQILNKLSPISNHINKIEYDKKTNIVSLTDEKNTEYKANYIILTSGYSLNINQIISPVLNKNIAEDELKDYFSNVLNKKGRNIARKLKDNKGNTIELYVIGTAAGVTPSWSLANKDDLEESKTKNSASINVLGPKTAEFAESL